MKKIFRYILLSALTITAVASCEDDRNNFLPEDSFGFNNKANENVITLPLYGGTYRLDVIKSGKGFNEGSVTIASIDTLLNAFNAANETAYVALPADKELYSFSAQTISFKAEDVTLPLEITWDVAKVAAYMETEPSKQYCIPVALHSDNLEVNEGRELFIINLVTSTVTTEQTLLSFTYEWESEPSSENRDITIRIDKSIPTIDLTLDFEVDNNLIAAYNEANGTNYEVAPEGLVTVGPDPVLKAGEGEVVFPVTINTEAIAEDMEIEVEGEKVTRHLIKRDWDGYVVPLKISGMSIDGVKVDNGLTYVVVKGIEPIPPQLFNREWGLYSKSSTNLWFTYLGISDARNITMDDDYIYIPQSSGGTPVLKAISIADPTNVKDVNVEGVETGEHTLSCVRMIPNTNTELNGGKDILIASNLSVGDGSHLCFYVWLDGIDAKPSRFQVEDSGRRLGDRFIIAGTWNSGEIYLKDYNMGTVVRYAMVNDAIGEWPGEEFAYARGALIYDDKAVLYPESVGIGSPYIYPGTPGAGSAILPHFFVAGQSEGKYLVNSDENKYDVKEDLKLKRTYGYSFFSDAKTGTRYISFVSIDENENSEAKKATVKTIADPTGTHDGFHAALKNQKLIFTAPLQDSIDPTVDAPVASSHVVGDCVVRTINGETYMAAMAQGIGLSLFKLNAEFIAE